MRRTTLGSFGIVTAIFFVGACSDTATTDPITSPITPSLDLVPPPGTAGTERYVPLLERVLRRAIEVVRESRGDDGANRIVGEYRRLRGELEMARETGDEERIRNKVAQLDSFYGSVALRIFTESVGKRCLRYAAAELESLRVRLSSASAAGQDVERLVNGARRASRYIEAGRSAADPLSVLLHAAHAADLLARINAAL